MSFMTDDCVYYASVGPEPGTTYRGPDEVRRGFAYMLTYDQERERHSGETVIVGDVGYATWSFDEVTPDGGRRTIHGCDLFRFRGERIVVKDAFRKLEPSDMSSHFTSKLAHETDPADVWKAIDSGIVDFVLVDCRPTGNYNKTHLPGAISLPWQEITAERVATLPDRPLVTYCWGPSCNAATKGAERLAALGRPVKEMIGGLEYWIREGHPTEGKRPVIPASASPSDWGLVG